MDVIGFRCDGYCRPSRHYHIAWAAIVGATLIALTLFTFIVMAISLAILAVQGCGV